MPETFQVLAAHQVSETLRVLAIHQVSETLLVLATLRAPETPHETEMHSGRGYCCPRNC